MHPDLILAIDPGTEESGWLFYQSNGNGGGTIYQFGTSPNKAVLELVRDSPGCKLAIEWIESQGMPVGKETFETVRWIGRFQQAFARPEEVMLIGRKAVKLNLCGSSKAKDPNVRQALLDRVGPQGKKKSPGPTYGVAGHVWSALALAVTADDQLRGVK